MLQEFVQPEFVEYDPTDEEAEVSDADVDDENGDDDVFEGVEAGPLECIHQLRSNAKAKARPQAKVRSTQNCCIRIDLD